MVLAGQGLDENQLRDGGGVRPSSSCLPVDLPLRVMVLLVEVLTKIVSEMDESSMNLRKSVWRWTKVYDYLRAVCQWIRWRE